MIIYCVYIIAEKEGVCENVRIRQVFVHEKAAGRVNALQLKVYLFFCRYTVVR